LSATLTTHDEVPPGAVGLTGRDPVVVAHRDVPLGATGLTGGGSVVDVYPRDLDELLSRLVEWFEEAENSSQDARELSERDRDYVNHKQWTSAEDAELKKRGQPRVTINKCAEKVYLLCGLERRNRSDPKAFPRTPTEEDRADAATQALRYIGDDNSIDVIRSAVYEEMLVEGFGGLEIGLVDDGKGGADVTLTHVPWDRLWVDPHSRRADFSDARYAGIVIWMDRDQLEETYPVAIETIEGAFAAEHSGTTYDDRPGTVTWSDSSRRRVRVVQCHWIEGGTWWSASFTKAGYLAEPQQSPHLDRRGKSACPLILQSAYIDRENRRYGIVRGMISLQDEINKRRSKALHLLSVNRTIAEQGAVADVDKARREVARPDGYIEIMPGMKFEVVPGGDLALGQFKLLEHATAEMQLSGPNAAMAGVASGDPSGRAIIAQQAGGAAANEPLSDSLRQWTRRVYEVCWMAARQYWTAGRWVRVTDDIGTTQWVGINRPVTVRDELAAMPEEQRAMAMQQLQIVPGDPRLQQVVRVENDVSDLEIDITIEEGMDVPALEHEQFAMLAQLAQAQPGIIPPDVLIAASGLRNKQVLLDRMKEAQEAAGQTAPQMQQLEMAKKQADVRATNAKAMADEALAKERDHASIHHIAEIHDSFRAPPDSASPANPASMKRGADMTLPPELVAADVLADIQAKAAKTQLDEAKARDLHFASVKKAAETSAILHPPPQQAPRRG
jgi:hypothetical protein